MTREPGPCPNPSSIAYDTTSVRLAAKSFHARRSCLARTNGFAVLALFALAAWAAPVQAQFSVQRTSSPVFYNDVGESPSLQGMYASYEITNTSLTGYGDVWVDIGNFSGGVVALAPTDDGLVHLGALTPGQTKSAFFYLRSTSTTFVPQTHDIRIYASRPPAAVVTAQSFSFSSVESTIGSNANKVTTVVSGPTPPGLGGIVTITVTGETGTIGASQVLAFTPAAGVTWPAETYEMIGATITLSGSANAGVLTDSLIYLATSASNTNYVAEYRFRAVSTTAAPTLVTPIAYIASGANIKHTDTGNFGGFDAVPVPANFATVSKIASPNRLVTGGVVTWTVRLTNAAAYPIFLDDAKDELPVGASYVPGSSTFDAAAIPDPGVTGATLAWGGFFTLPASSARDLTYQTTLPNGTATYTNSALAHIGAIVVDSTTTPSDSLPAHATVRVGPLEADLSIVKSATPDPVAAGSPLTYRLIVTNAGFDTATVVTVVDTLAGSATYVSSNTTAGTVGESGGVVTAAIGAMAPGRVDTVTVIVTPTAGGLLPNTARVLGTEPDPDTGDNVATISTTVTVGAGPNMATTKSDGGATFAVGGNGVYTITVINLGGSATTETITVTDTLAGGLAFLGGAGAGWTVNQASGIVTATNPGPLAPGDTASFALTVAVSAPAAPQVTNVAIASTAGDTSAVDDDVSVTTTVTGGGGAPDLATAKSDGGATFTVGVNGTYTITVRNLGGSATSGTITVSDTLAAGLSFVSGTGTGWVVSEAGGIVTGTNPGPIAAGDSASFTLTVAVAGAAVPAVTYTAVASTAFDTTTTNNSGSVTTIVSPASAPDVATTKRSGGPFTVGTNGTYTIVTRNVGSLPTSATITVLDTLPTGLAYVSGTGAGWTVNEASGIVTATNPGPIAAGDSASFTLTVAVGPTALPAVVNAAVAGTAGDGDPANDTGRDSTGVNPAPGVIDLVTTKTDGGGFVVGGTGGYTITVENVGTGATGAVGVLDTLAAGLTFVSGAGAGWTVSESGGIVTASNPGPLAPGDTASFSLAVAIGAAATPSVDNAAVVSAAGDTVSGNDRSAITTLVAGAPDMATTKRSGGPFTVGTNGTYTIVTRNVGSLPTSATITVLDTLPTGLAYVSGAGAGWTVNEASGIVTATNPGPIAAGDSASFTLTVAVGPAALPAVVNAAVASTAGDVGTGNDTGRDSTGVNPAPVAPDLATTKTDGGGFTVGGTGGYTIVVRNLGTGPTTGGVTVLDTLAAGLTFVDGSGTGWTVTEGSGIVTATNPGPIAPGDSASFTLTVAIAAAAAPGVDNAAFASTAGDTDPGNDGSAITTPVAGAPDLALAKSHSGDFRVGVAGTYSLVVRNVGSLVTTGAITVLDTLPGGLSYVSATGAGWSVSEAGGMVTATHPAPLAAGDSASFTLTVAVGVAAQPSVTNAAVAGTAGDVGPGNDRALDPTTVLAPAPDLATAKIALTSLGVGAAGSYRITVHNVGSVATSSPITVTDILPAGLTYQTGAGVGWSVAALAQTVTATYAAALAAGDSASFDLDVQVDGAAYPSVTNTALAATTGDPDPSNDAGSVTSSVAGGPDLALEKRHTAPFIVGSDGAYTLVVRNIGVAPTTGPIAVTDSLPTGLSFVSGAGFGWSFAPSGNAVVATNTTSVAPGDSLVFTVTTAVSAAALPAVTNLAAVQTAGDAVAANDRVTDPTVIDGAPDVTLAKRADAAFTVGVPGSYTLVVMNVGTAVTAGAITVRDTLARGLTFASATGTGWSFSTFANVVTATYAPTLAPGDSAVFTLAVNVALAAFPAIGNAAVAQTSGDPFNGNDRGVSGSVPVGISADLVAEKTAVTTDVEVPGAATFSITVRNIGVSAIPGVDVSDTLPVGFRHDPGSTRLDGSPLADPAGAPGLGLTFAIGTVPAGGARTLVYRTRVDASALLGDGVNRAWAGNASLGVRSNTASASVRLRGGAFAPEGVLVGKVWLEDACDSSRAQHRRELGIPGVRLYLEDGRSVVTDVEGKYSFAPVTPRLHVIKVDRTTLPAGSRLLSVDTRSALDPGSRFVDLVNGEMHRADFALAGDAGTTAEVLARRELGEVRAALVSGQPTGPGATGTAAGSGAPRVEDGVYHDLLPDATHDAANSRVADPPGQPGLLTTHLSEPRTLELSVPRSPVPADGRTLVPVTVRAPGTTATRVTLEAGAGLWQVRDLDPRTEGIQTDVPGTATFLLVAPPQASLATVRATRVTTFEGPVLPEGPDRLQGVDEAQTTIAFVPEARRWIISGVLQGRFDARSLVNDELVTGQRRDGFEESLDDVSTSSDDGTAKLAGRGAVFARGRLDPRTLVTLRYDSERADEKRRFDDLRPEEGYPLFGDAAIRGFEAQSTDRLYARVDRERSYLLYGDLLTPGPTQERALGAYVRSLNGAQAHLEDHRGVLDAFASHERDRQVVDEIPGQGISGPYALSRSDGLLYTERVEIITRDRNNPSLILVREPLTRFADYSIEPLSGRLLFRRPVRSVDERLNPVSIRVIYEVAGGGDRFWTFGATGAIQPVARLSLSGSYAREDDPLVERTFGGAGATLELVPGTFLTGEWARSDSASAGTGDAWRAEVRHGSRQFDLRAFAVRTDADFANPSAGFGPGREEVGGAGRFALDGRTALTAEGVRTKDRITDGRRKGATAAVERRFGSKLLAELGYRWARESAVPAGGGPGAVTPNEVDALRTRVALQFTRRTSASLEYENDLNRKQSERAVLGADVRLTDHVRFFGRHEFLNGFAGPYAMNPAQGLNTTVIGLVADPTEDLQAFSEYRIRDAYAGRLSEAVLGLRNRWTLSRGVRLDGSFERVHPVVGEGTPGVEDATAIAGALEWTSDPRTKSTVRLEYRDAESASQWLAGVALARKLSRDWTGLLRSNWAWSPEADRTSARTQFALALRETDRSRWNGLGRVEHRIEETGPQSAGGNRHEALIGSAHLNLRPAPRFTLAGQLAAKSTKDKAYGSTVSNQATLLGGRGTYDLSARWDVSLAARLLMNGSYDRRNEAIGAELGWTPLRNLRVAGGFNAFGFKEPDIPALQKTDRGGYVDVGFKFDELLFGGSKDEAGRAQTDDVAAGASTRAEASPPDTSSALLSAGIHVADERITDEAIATDLSTVDAWRRRVAALPDSVDRYLRTKADAWLVLARNRYVEGDRTGDADSALARAVALHRALTDPIARTDGAYVALVSDQGLALDPGPVAPDLVAEAKALRAHAGFRCAEVEVAQLEVALARSAVEARDRGICGAHPVLTDARALADKARAEAEECVKPMPPPVDTTVAPLPPDSALIRVQAALSEIPSGIHFAVNKSDLAAPSREVCRRIGAILVEYPQVRVELEGHTDSRGSAEYNRRLSERRVNAVRAALVAAGVDSSRIRTSFAGKEGLLTAERDARELALNRRVDFKYFDAQGNPISTRKQTEDLQIEGTRPPRPGR